MNENSSSLIIIYEEITLPPEWKITSGGSFLPTRNNKDDVERLGKRGEMSDEDRIRMSESSGGEEGR